jgi:methionine synthase I (cobalamin-dependent)
VSTRDLPVIVSLWRWPDAMEDAARRLVDAGAAAVGLNCRPAPGKVPEIVRRLARAVTCPLLVKPGVASDDPDARSTPSAFAAALVALVEYNVRLVGGCCGTTEAHVAAIAAACSSHPHTGDCRGTAP